MSDDDIKAFCSLLLAAGGETTDKAIASMMANLLAHPDQLVAVREDRSLVASAFVETLRHTPPVHMITRQAATDVEVTGGTIPQGATVTFLVGAANRDERRYRYPDRFDIFRDDLTTTSAFSAAADHLAFALGRHFCVGALLAKAEVEIGINQSTRRRSRPVTPAAAACPSAGRNWPGPTVGGTPSRESAAVGASRTPPTSARPSNRPTA
ncbi:hypothetical protein SUDANB66_06624 (plasmid) [Streptomyces sp. SudanB66_2053]